MNRVQQAEILLIDLPTFPKGTVALSLYAVGASLQEYFRIRYLDANLYELPALIREMEVHLGGATIAGLKVSSQNFPFAQQLSEKIKEVAPETKVLWGGEFPTLVPEACTPFCDTVVSGQFEPVAEQFTRDFMNNSLKPSYKGGTPKNLEFVWQPDFSINKRLDEYFQFMGLPLETSRGRTESCVFCFVHVMQKNYVLKSSLQLEKEL